MPGDLARPTRIRRAPAAPDEAALRDLRQVAAMPEVPLLLELCRAASGLGFVAIARAVEGRWLACATLGGSGIGPGEELDLAPVLDVDAHGAHGPVAIGGAAHRGRPAALPHGFACLVCVPIVRPDGTLFGTLCAGDPARHRIGPKVLDMFGSVSQLVAAQLDVRHELEEGRTALASERDTARLREEFIAVVGHDLRNPVAAVSAGLRRLGKGPDEAEAAELLAEMQRAALRMGQIIDNLLDFARGRLGAGIEIEAGRAVELGPVLGGVAQEVARLSGQEVALALDLPRPVRCDPQRIGQLLSNLLGNAVTHGAPGAPIRVEAREADGRLRLAVTNRGAPIPEAVRPSLFLPFSRGGDRRTSLQGLGLGLYIAFKIARAHGGRIDVKSGEATTTFAFTMPVMPVPKS